jgi:hypothetical protein
MRARVKRAPERESMTDRLDAQIDGAQAAGEDIAAANVSIASEPTIASAAESLEIARAAMTRVADNWVWVGPLFEAIGSCPTPGVQFGTIWGGTSVYPPTPDAAKHEEYVRYIRSTLEGCPWLLPMLEAAGATVLASPGFFCFMVSSRPNAAFEIPELRTITYLIPWVEPGEVAQ